MSCSTNYVVPGANPCIGEGGGTAGVSSLNNAVGGITLQSGDEIINVTTIGQTISLTSSPLSSGVASLNSLSGILAVTSTDSTVNINASGTTIDLSVPAGDAPVQSVGGQVGAITLSSTDSTVTITADAGNINFSAPAPVLSVGGEQGAITLSSNDSTVTITADAGNINFSSVAPVQSVAGAVGTITMGSSDSSITVSQASNNIDLVIANPGVKSIAGQIDAVTMSSNDGTIVITADAGNIDLSALIPKQYVQTIADQSGLVTLSSNNGSVTITADAGNIDFAATGSGGGVTSVAGLQGAITFGSEDNSVQITPNSDTNINLTVNYGTIVQTLNGNTGSVTLASSDSSVSITTDGQGTINFQTASSPSTQKTISATLTSDGDGLYTYYFTTRQRIIMNDTSYQVVVQLPAYYASNNNLQVDITKNVESVGFRTYLKYSGSSTDPAPNVTFDFILVTNAYTNGVLTNFAFPPFYPFTTPYVFNTSVQGEERTLDTVYTAEPPTNYNPAYNESVIFSVSVVGNCSFNGDTNIIQFLVWDDTIGQNVGIFSTTGVSSFDYGTDFGVHINGTSQPLFESTHTYIYKYIVGGLANNPPYNWYSAGIQFSFTYYVF
jgi:hypothetical protein